MLDRYTTGLLTVENAYVRKNLGVSIHSGVFCLELEEIHELALVANLS